MGIFNSASRDKFIKFLVQNFELSNNEANIYISLYERGKSSILELSKYTDINRATVHTNTETLLKKGLAVNSISEHGRKRLLIAQDPQKLGYILDNKMQKLNESKDEFNEIVNLIKSFKNTNNDKDNIQIQYYTGLNEVNNSFNDFIQGNELRTFAHYDRYFQIFPESEAFWKRLLKDYPQREVWEILICTNLSKRSSNPNSFSNYHAKYMPARMNDLHLFFSDILISENQIEIIQLDEKNPKAALIESKTIAQSFRYLHQTFWNLL